MHCNITKATTVKVWVWVLRHTTPLTHICLLIARWGVAWCEHLRNPLPSDHAGCVITTSRVFSFFSLALDSVGALKQIRNSILYS